MSVFTVVCHSSIAFYSHADNFKDRNTPDSILLTILLHPSNNVAGSDCTYVHEHDGVILAMYLQFEIKLFIISTCI
jgi:hypothetical protein